MKLKREMTVVNVAGEMMAVPLGSDDGFHGILKMNETTAEILNILKEDTTAEEIAGKLFEIYDAPLEVIKESVDRVIEKLKENNLISE